MAVSRHSVFLRKLAWLGAAQGPFWVLRLTPPLVGWSAALLSKDARRRVVANLHLIRGEASTWRDTVDTMRTFASFAGALGESLASGSKNERPLEPIIEGGEHLKSVLGRPFIIGTIHSGGWDVLGALMTGDLQQDMVVVMAHEADPAAERLRWCGRDAARSNHAGDANGPGSTVRCGRCLARRAIPSRAARTGAAPSDLLRADGVSALSDCDSSASTRGAEGGPTLPGSLPDRRRPDHGISSRTSVPVVQLLTK